MGIDHYTPDGCCPCSLLSSYTHSSDAAASDLCRRPIVRKSAPNLCKLKFHSRNTWPASATNSKVTIVSGMMNVCSTIHNIHTHTLTQSRGLITPATSASGSGRQLGAPYNCSKSSRERAEAQTRCHFWEICSACARRSQRRNNAHTAQRVSLLAKQKKATKLLWWQWQWQCTGYGQGAGTATATTTTTT